MHRRATISALFALLAGCGGVQQGAAPDAAAPHIGDAWFAHRATSLGIAPDRARARDAALPEDEPPSDEVFDVTLADESAVLWRDLCASCHGLEGRLEGAAPMEPEPRKWGSFGAQMGFFFGGDAMRAGIYRKIAEGVTTESGRQVMPAWGQVLSKEQIWGLVRHIEGF